MNTKYLITWSFLLFFLSSEIKSQSYTPRIEEVGSNQLIKESPSPLVTLPTNTADLRLNYLNANLPSVTPFLPHNSYKPLEVLWEFTYSGGGLNIPISEYSFQQEPKMVFPQNGKNVDIILHSLDNYDGDEPPPERSNYRLEYNSSSTSKVLSFTAPNLKILPSWDPSPDDIIIYIIRLELTECPIDGKIKFDFPNSFFTNSIISKPSGNHTINPSGSPLGNSVEWDIKNFPFFEDGTKKYRDFYVELQIKSKAFAPIGSVINTNASYTIDGGCGGPLVDSSRDTVDISHDPNQKIILSPEVLCTNSQRENGYLIVDYKIEYQNIGKASAMDVTVEDWLDEKDHVKLVTFLDSKDAISDMTFNASNQYLNPSVDGYMYWHFEYPNTNGRQLRGKEEAGYNIDFYEEDTKGWLTCRVLYDTLVLESCNALMNHARVTFDCNPEFYTNTTIHEHCCLTFPGAPPPLPCNLVDSAFIATTELEDLSGLGTSFQLNNTWQSRIAGIFGPTAFLNWYPDRWIEPNNSLTAVLTPLEDITYTLVVSSDSIDVCSRGVYKITVDVDDHDRTEGAPIKLLNDNDLADCTCTPVVIGGSPEYAYAWSDGSTASSYSISSGVKANTLTVTDAHGCTAILPTTINCGGYPYWCWWLLFLFIILLLWIWWRFFFRR